MRTRVVVMAVTGLLASSLAASSPQSPPEGTFSIVARDPKTGDLGMAVQSKALATGSRTITIKGGVAVIAHQSQSNPMYGTLGLELLTAGMAPQQALDMMLRSDEQRDTRQVAILDAAGRTAAWTGPGALDWKGHRCGTDFCTQGNILTGPDVVQAIANAFESSTGPLAERMLTALDVGQHAGGDARGTQAAALVATAYARLKAKEFPQASEAASTAREKSPEFDEAWVAWAAVELGAGRTAGVLDAIRRAIELNAANKRQLPEDTNFESLWSDPEFKKLVGS